MGKFIFFCHISAFPKQQGKQLSAIPEKIDNNDSELGFRSQTASGSSVLALPPRGHQDLEQIFNCPVPRFPFFIIGTIIVLPLQEDKNCSSVVAPCTWVTHPPSWGCRWEGLSKDQWWERESAGCGIREGQGCKCWKIDAKDPICLLFGS